MEEGNKSLNSEYETKFLDEKDYQFLSSLIDKDKDFKWYCIPDNIFLKTDKDLFLFFHKSEKNNQMTSEYFYTFKTDRKVFDFCKFYNYLCTYGDNGCLKYNRHLKLIDLIKVYYEIVYEYELDDLWGQYKQVYKYDLPIIKEVYRKFYLDDEIIKDLENEPSLQNVMKYYRQNDIKKALGELRKVYEEDKFNKFIEGNSNEVKFIYYFVIKMASIYAVHLAGKGIDKKRIQQTEFADRTEKLQNALNEYKNTNGIITNNNDILEKLQKYSGFMFNHMIDQKNLQLAYQDMTETEARIWLDLGLSIYRLYLMNSK